MWILLILGMRVPTLLNQELYAPSWVLLLLGLRVPTPSICVGYSDPRTGSTHAIEPIIMCALVGTPATRTESTHAYYMCGYS